MFHKAAPGGKMGHAEFKRYIDGLGIFPKVEAVEEFRHLFRGYDHNGDEDISFIEFLQYHATVMFDTDKEMAFDIIFQMYNKQTTEKTRLGQDFITKEDIVEVITDSTRWMGKYDVALRQVQEMIEGEATKLMASCDLRKTGRITKEDLHTACNADPDIFQKLKAYA